MFRKLNILIVLVTFLSSLLTPVAPARAQALLGLPEPGTMVSVSPAYKPAMIKGLLVRKDNPFVFDFLVDPGEDHLTGNALKKESTELIKYFLAGLTIPDKDLWVNLSPYEKDRIIPEVLGQTAMGRDLLAEDYILKQITASLIYPDKGLGREFWDKVYTKARQLYGTTQVPVNTFNKVWITADKAKVYEHNNLAFVVDCHLKVMLEEDYLATKKHMKVPQNETDAIGSAIVRQIVLPELEKEVNSGKNFSKVRQIFNSIILASWYKENLKQALLTQVYADKATVKGIDLKDKSIKGKIYRRYLQAYKKGVFNFIREDAGPEGIITPRKYFSGGMDPGMASRPDSTEDGTFFDAAMARTSGDLQQVTANLVTDSSTDDDLFVHAEGMPQDEETYFRGRVFRTLPNGTVRISEIWDPLLESDRLVHLVEQIINDPDAEAAFVKESILRRSERQDQKVLLNSGSGVVSQYFVGKEVTVARTATEVLRKPVSDDLTYVENAREVDVRAGGYFRITLHDYGTVLKQAFAVKGIDANQVWELLKKQYYIYSNGMFQTKFTKTPDYKKMILPGLNDEQRKQVFDIMQQFRIYDGEDLYLLTNNYERRQQTGEDKLTAPGGTGRFYDMKDSKGKTINGKILYTKAGLGNMQQIKASPLDVDDPFAIRVRIEGEDCWKKFMEMFILGIGRERFFPIREFYEELVGSKTIPIGRARTIAQLNPLLDPDNKNGLWHKTSANHVQLRYGWETYLPHVGTTEDDLRAIAGAGYEKALTVIQLAQLLSENSLLPPYPDFYAQEFNQHLSPENLIAILEAHGIQVPSGDDPLQRLNMLLEDKNLRKLLKVQSQEEEPRDVTHRLNQGLPVALFDIKKLNRILLTLNFPENAPGKRGYFPFNGWPYRKLGPQKKYTKTMREIMQALVPSTVSGKNGSHANGHSRLGDRRPRKGDPATVAHGPNGGIDLSTQGIKWDITQDGQGPEMRINRAMIARIRREGLQSLTPVISRIASVENIWPLAGLQAPAR